MQTTRRQHLAQLFAAAATTTALSAAPTKPMRGAFMILATPFTPAGAVDWDDLAREAEFVDRAGAHGMVWPQGSSSVAVLTKEERLHGMELLVKTMRGKRAVLGLGVQGKDTAEMLDYARRAEELAPDCFIAMPPSSGKSLDDYRAYFRALGSLTQRPVIMQTSGGAKDLPPSVELMAALAREFPHMSCIKEESEPVVERMLAEIKLRPPFTSIFGANFGQGWLYEMRLGLDGVITGNAMYADLMARMWDLHVAGKHAEAMDAYSKFLLIRNAGQQIPGAELYIFKKRGIFKSTAVRRPGGKVAEAKLSPEAIAEIDVRFATLRPYLIS